MAGRRNGPHTNFNFLTSKKENDNIFSVDMQSIRIVPKWRNWQTHQTQNLTLATACRFKSGLRHQKMTGAFRNWPEGSFIFEGRRLMIF